jgi:putative two-component system response regulator
MAMDIAHYHHERYDGRGYPCGLAGRDIPLSARIVCLADCYDAIRMKREYKPARSHEEATVEIARARGTQFDPHVVEAYFHLGDAVRRLYDEMAEQSNRPLLHSTDTALPRSQACSVEV